MTVTEVREELQKLEEDGKGDYKVMDVTEIKQVLIFDEDKEVEFY